jgi:hypothetical protein
MKIVICIIFIGSFVFGQNEKKNEAAKVILNESLTILPEQPLNNTAPVLSENLKQITWVNGNNNASSLKSLNSMQIGNSNYLYLTQEGNNINSTILQAGNGNTYEGNLQGNDVSNYILQRGSVQYINQTVNGNRLEYSIIQEGINNKIYQLENNSALTNYQIRQIGINMQLIIVNGKQH